MKKLSGAAMAAGIVLSAAISGCCTDNEVQNEIVITPSATSSRAVVNPWQQPRKKLIDMSWSNPSVDYLVENLARMEQEAQVDGITVRFVGRKPGVEGKAGDVHCHNIITKDVWQYEWFADQIAKYNNLNFTRFTDNFIYTTMTPARDMDWFDDAYWAAICNNYGILARISKECNMTGIVFDSEEYGGRVWGNYKGSDRDAAIAKARQRGQEWGRAVFTENPNVTLLCLFFFSHGTFIMGDAESSTLIHSFYNGVMDVMPPTATILDGHEYFGYFGRNYECYAKLRYDIDHTFRSRVAANNFAKYRTQVQLAAPMYIDAVTGANASFHRFLVPEIDNQPRLDFIRQCLWNAMCVSDEYVWFYSERGCFWSRSHHPRVASTWDEKIPGFNAMLAELREITAIDLTGLSNILVIPQLNSDPAVKEPGPWQFHATKEGDATDKSGWKDGKVYITGPQTDSYTAQSVTIQPGKRYLLKVETRVRTNESNGLIYMGISFSDADGKALPQSREVCIQQLTGGYWEEIVFLITAPENATTATYKLGVKGLLADQVIEFQHPQLIELP